MLIRRSVVAALAAATVLAALPATAVPGAKPPIALDALASAPVPSVCGHPAGRLVDGELPGIPGVRGGVWLYDSHRSAAVFAVGSLRSVERPAAVVEINCFQGGSAHPSHLVAYSSDVRIIGHLPLTEIGGGRPFVRRIRIHDGEVRVRVGGIHARHDGLCCGTRTAALVLRLDAVRGDLVVVSRRVFGATAPARRLLRAADVGRMQAVNRLADPVPARQLLDLGREGEFSSVRCHPALSRYWPDLNDRMRVCEFTHRAAGVSSDWQVGMRRHGFRTWRAAAVRSAP